MLNYVLAELRHANQTNRETVCIPLNFISTNWLAEGLQKVTKKGLAYASCYFCWAFSQKIKRLRTNDVCVLWNPIVNITKLKKDYHYRNEWSNKTYLKKKHSQILGIFKGCLIWDMACNSQCSYLYSVCCTVHLPRSFEKKISIKIWHGFLDLETKCR